MTAAATTVGIASRRLYKKNLNKITPCLVLLLVQAGSLAKRSDYFAAGPKFRLFGRDFSPLFQ